MTRDPTIDDAVLAAALDPVPARFEVPDGMRAAAVVAPLFRRGGHDHLLVLKRRRDLRRHGGELAFPGGRREVGETPLATALREMEEETGLAPEDVTVLGALPAMPSLGGYQVHVVVGRIPPPLYLRVDANEIEHALEFAVHELRDETRWEMKVGRGARRPSPHFVHNDGELLWGLTAMFTRTILARAGSAAGRN